MRFLLHSEYQVARDHVWDLFCFTLENNFVAILHTLFDLDIQSLHIVDNLASLAVRAVGSIGLSPASAPVAVRLHLHLHAEADLDLLHDDALAVALGALLRLAVLRTRTSALRAVHITRDRHVS